MKANFRNEIQWELDAVWWYDDEKQQYSDRSWLFYIFLDLCADSLLIINGKETSDKVQQYFDNIGNVNWREYKDAYSSIVNVDGKQITFTISSEEDEWDVLDFKI